jgi:hypothetical protein
MKCEQREMGELFAGNVADLGEIRLSKNGKMERERRANEAEIRDIRENFDEKMRDAERKHRDVVHVIERV